MSRPKPDSSPGLREAVKAAAHQGSGTADPVRQSAPAHFNMNHALMLEVFREPITFYPTYVEFTGSVTAALMLSYACYTSDRLNDEYPGFDGWFHKRQEDWSIETGLSRRELESSRQRLRELGLLEEKRVGAPPILLCRVDFTRLNELMNRQAQANWAEILPAA
ncbi:MAG: hypothetical protein WBX11_13960 [Thiobacillaceae bacterium]